MLRALGDWSKCFEGGGQFGVVGGGSGVGLVVGRWFGEVRAWCPRVCGVWHHRVGIVVAGAQVELVIAVGAAAAVVVVQPRRRMEQGHCEEEGSLGAKMAVVGIEVLQMVRICLIKTSTESWHTLLRIGGVVSLRVLLRWCCLRGVTPTIALLLAPILVCWLSLSHRSVQKILVIPARLDESLVELCEII
jgi:hypothetical protein